METKVESVYKGGNKEKIQETQRGIFLMNIVFKYMRELRNYKMKITKYIYQVCKLQERKQVNYR